MKRIIALVLAVIMCTVLFAACSEKPETNGEVDSGAVATDNAGKTDDVAAPIKIGGTAPLTGGAAVYGTAAANGAKIAVEEINALGGLQFELKYEDDAHDAEKAVNAYNTLKDWGVQITLGSVTSAPGSATSTLNYTDGIFALTPSASSTAVTEGKNNVFQMCFSDPNQGSASAQYIYDSQLGTKIAIIYKNDDVYSTGIYNTFNSKAAELGLDVVSATTFTSDSQNDFTVQLTEAKNAGADLIFLPIYCEAASLILTQANTMGYAPSFFGVDGMDGILTLEGFDNKLAEDVMLLTPFNADAEDERTQAFVEKYNELYDVIPNQFAADAYDCIYAIYQACNAANITSAMTAQETNDLLVEQFTTMKFDGLTGTNVTWDETGAVTKAPKGMVIKNGVYVGMD